MSTYHENKPEKKKSRPNYNWFEKWAIQGVIYEKLLEAIISRQTTVSDLRDPNQRYGFLEDAILGPDLCFPDEDREVLNFEQAAPGEWVAYDFNRPKQFPEAYKGEKPPSLKFTGKLMAYMLDEVEGRPSDQRTPVDLLHVFNFDHAFTLGFPSIDELVEDHGYLKSTSYEEAYDAAGLYDQFAEDLALRGLEQHQLYTITPKGNTLVRLADVGSP